MTFNERNKHSLKSSCTIHRSWEDLDQHRNVWNRLWKESRTIRDELHDYEFMKQVSFDWEHGTGQPLGILHSVNEEPVLLAPFVVSSIRLTSFRIRVRAATFVPNPFIYRRALFGIFDHYEPLLGEMVQILKSESVDLTILNGLEESYSKRLFKAISPTHRTSILQVNSAKGGKPGTASVDHCIVDVSRPWSRYLETRSVKFRKNLKKTIQKIRDRSSFRFWQFSGKDLLEGSPTQPERLVSWIRCVEKNSWKHSKNLHLGHAGYDKLTSLIERLFSLGSLHLAFLFMADRPISFNFGFVEDCSCRSIAVGYDSNYRHLTPGIVLRARVIENLCDKTTLSQFNLGGSNHIYKRNFSDFEDSGYEITIYGTTVKASLIYWLRHALGQYHCFTLGDDESFR